MGDLIHPTYHSGAHLKTDFRNREKTPFPKTGRSRCRLQDHSFRFNIQTKPSRLKAQVFCSLPLGTFIPRLYMELFRINPRITTETQSRIKLVRRPLSLQV